jgi:5-methylcytosine-specific restriction protein A
MDTYLYTWNPRLWSWVDLGDAVSRVANDGAYYTQWSCGITKRIKPRDRFLLMRLGVEPKGIVGGGYIQSSPHPRLHWDEAKAAGGKKILGTDVTFTSLDYTPAISHVELGQLYPDVNWTPQASGTTLDDQVAREILKRLATSGAGPVVEPPAVEAKLFKEGRRRNITVKTYDRSTLARQACIEHHGYDCAVCRFNFAKSYGAWGESYIEVHHLKPVSTRTEEYLIDPVQDLRPVCANCHRMLHRRRDVLSIEELVAHNKSLNATSLRSAR